jgi:hypothetical protein
MISRSLLLTAVILFTPNAPAVWQGPPQMLAALDPETREWVKDLKNKGGTHAATRRTVSLSRWTAGIWPGPSTTRRE